MRSAISIAGVIIGLEYIFVTPIANVSGIEYVTHMDKTSPSTEDLRKILLDHGHRIIDAIKKEKSVSRFQPDEPEVIRDKHEEDEEVERCPHGYTLAWYETRSQVCDDCKDSQAELQASESIGK